MVTVKNYTINTNSNNEASISLILQGDLEVIQCKQTGNFYETTQSCRIPSIVDEHTAQLMIGKSIQGNIIKVPCNPYEYKVSDDGEVIILDYRYEFSKEDVSIANNHIGKNDSDLENINAQIYSL